MLAWPRRSLTTLGCTPLAMRGSRGCGAGHETASAPGLTPTRYCTGDRASVPKLLMSVRRVASEPARAVSEAVGVACSHPKLGAG